MAAGPDSRHVFINAPFDRSYEPLFVTLVGSLVFLGQKPHCVLEVREQGDGRLKRILDLMRRCRISMHDISRVGMPVRFNMPFELGLACALQLTSPHKYEVFVFDAKEHRPDVTLSDYKGRDPMIHNGTCEGMIACLLDSFKTRIPNAAKEFRRCARLLRQSTEVLKHDLKAKSLFRPAVFRGLVAGAMDIALEHQFIEP
jgi:hypothetical protein